MMMTFVQILPTILFLASLLILDVESRQIPFINNAFLSPTYNCPGQSVIVVNQSCSECLCTAAINQSNIAYSALNCFPNYTCQFFPIFPRTYTVQPLVQARLYFLQGILPNASQNSSTLTTTQLLACLASATPQIVPISKPRTITFDWELNQLIVIQVVGNVSRFNVSSSLPLTLLSTSSLGITYTYVLAIRNSTYYVSSSSSSTPGVYLFDSRTLSPITNATASSLTTPRGLMFLNSGLTLAVASLSDQQLYLFDINSRSNLTLANYISTPFTEAQGLLYLNDSCFYATSYVQAQLFTMTRESSNSTIWNATLFATATSAYTYGSRVVIDDIGRRWFILSGYGLQVYNEAGVSLGNWSITDIFDMIILDKYVLILSDKGNNRLLRYDPNIDCCS